eukprot:COSAG05_NODE_5432_length_1176_cov_1.687094_1_plen_61_part_00
MRTALLDVVAPQLEAAVAPLGDELALAVVCDVSSPQSCDQALQAVEAKWPGMSISFLFNK